MSYTVHVTRDASITYSAKVDLPLSKIKARCNKYGFDATGLEITWEETAKTSYDNVEVYEIEDSTGETVYKEERS